jgi:hypothetical protein
MSLSESNAPISNLLSNIASYSKLSNSKNDFVRTCIQISLKKMDGENLNKDDNFIHKSLSECLFTYLDLMRRSGKKYQ